MRKMLSTIGGRPAPVPITQLFLAICMLLLGAAEAVPTRAQECVGDCDGNGAVAINELIIGVNIALGAAPQNSCSAFDSDQSGTVTISELITAVNSALNGCGFQPPMGVVLSGNPSGLAIDATVDMPPVGVDEDEIQDGVILTRLDVHLAPGATVGQVNAALELVNAGVVSMLHGHPTLTIAIPRPVDLDALANVVETLRQTPGISWTAIARVADPKILPPSPAGDELSELQPLLPTRLPAAWNASHLATNGCAGRKVTVLVADTFQRLPLSGPYARFVDEIPESNFTRFGGLGPRDNTHGYDVTTTLAALFDATNPTGANPFTECLEVNAIEVGGLSEFEKWDLIRLSFPTGKFLLNYSMGYPDKLSQTLLDECAATGCTSMKVEQEIDLPLTRAYGGAEWILLTLSRWDDFLLSVAAGNERNKPGTAIYDGLGIAVFDSGMSVATLLPDDGFLFDGFSWNPKVPPEVPVTNFPKLTASDAEIGKFHVYKRDFGVDAAGPANNVLLVGSTTAGDTFDTLVESAFSDSSPDLFADGEGVFELDGLVDGGTSLATPQVTGLASYLWLLSSDLRSRPTSATREAILANVRGVGVIDAYASALSLDAAALPSPASAPVRLAILDMNDDTKFDEADLDTFLDKLFTGDGIRDYSRFDLNGDGFTGGSTTERFDLDRVGSTQYGATQYSTVMQSIEGEMVSFDETQLTDLQILCYYAYSALYTGDPDARQQLTAGQCTVSVTVDPAAVTVDTGGSQQFAATVRGTGDPRVTWSVTSGNGAISPIGLFSAGQDEGTAIVRATSVADPHAFGEATVTVMPAVPIVVVPSRGHLDFNLGEPATWSINRDEFGAFVPANSNHFLAGDPGVWFVTGTSIADPARTKEFIVIITGTIKINVEALAPDATTSLGFESWDWDIESGAVVGTADVAITRTPGSTDPFPSFTETFTIDAASAPFSFQTVDADGYTLQLHFGGVAVLALGANVQPRAVRGPTGFWKWGL